MCISFNKNACSNSNHFWLKNTRLKKLNRNIKKINFEKVMYNFFTQNPTRKCTRRPIQLLVGLLERTLCGPFKRILDGPCMNDTTCDRLTATFRDPSNRRSTHSYVLLFFRRTIYGRSTQQLYSAVRSTGDTFKS